MALTFAGTALGSLRPRRAAVRSDPEGAQPESASLAVRNVPSTLLATILKTQDARYWLMTAWGVALYP